MWSVDFGQPSGEFWRATPRRFRALQKRHIERVRQSFQPTANWMAMYAQAHGVKDSKPENFMPKAETEQKQKPATGMGPEVFYAFEKAFEHNG